MVGGKYEEIKVSTKERRKTFLRQAAMGLYQTAKLQRDRQVSPDLLKKCYREKKLVLLIRQLPALLVLVFFSAAFSAVMQQTLWNKKWNQSKHQLRPSV